MKLREWLLSQGCTHVAMESTGVYWKPVFAILEGPFELVVAIAHKILVSIHHMLCQQVSCNDSGDLYLDTRNLIH
ncbi:MAG TPA: hypothetical protein VNX60_00445 [Candidatus Acidoferrum sp.]|nr:hypothetical protein [Candidatus Acidoferrum sp.]